MNRARQNGSDHELRESLLLKKVRLLGLQLPVDLERLAVDRGCDYYQRDLGPRFEPLGSVPISNAELAIALLVPSLEPTLREIRLAAAILGASDVRGHEVAMLAIQEGCVEIVRHIAVCGHHFEPDNRFWTALFTLLPEISFQPEVLPHPSRFVEMTGIDRGKVGVSTRWIRPRTLPPPDADCPT